MITPAHSHGKSDDSIRIYPVERYTLTSHANRVFPSIKMYENCGKNWDVGWIYISPHLDDVVLSCGGLVWEQIQKGERVEIWTICAADPPPVPLSPYAASLHERWQTEQAAPDQRREEDRLACQRLGAIPRYFDLPLDVPRA